MVLQYLCQSPSFLTPLPHSTLLETHVEYESSKTKHEIRYLSGIDETENGKGKKLEMVEDNSLGEVSMVTNARPYAAAFRWAPAF